MVSLARKNAAMFFDQTGLSNVDIYSAKSNTCLSLITASMYPIIVKIDFAEVVQAGKSPKPVLLIILVNWAIKPFTMFAIATFFLDLLFGD